MSHDHNHDRDDNEERYEETERGELRHIRRLLERILDRLPLPQPNPNPQPFPVGGIITQGVINMPLTGTIKGLLPGGSDTFFITPVDTNGNADALPTGSPVPTITADDPTVTITPAADGLSATVTAAATATPGAGFNLNWAATYTKPDGTTASITATAKIPILTPVPPPVLLPVGGVISQGAPAA